MKKTIAPAIMRMYFLYSFICVVSFLMMSFVFIPSKDCSKIRNGQFYYYEQKTRSKIEVERRDSLQLEKNTVNGKTLRCKIIWKADCEYDMYINAFSDTKLSGADSVIAATPTSVRIVTVDNEKYICTWKLQFAGRNFEGRDTIYLKP